MRIKLIIVVVGLVMAFFGIQEFRVSRGTTSEPLVADLTKLEGGEALTNNHIRLGKHFAYYPGTVYSYRQSKYSSAEPTGSTSISYCYYPVVSTDHAFVKTLADLLLAERQGEEGGAGEAVQPADETLPDLRDFTVLVKTKRFDTINAIPESFAIDESIQGLVINRIESLSSEEKKLLHESFPGANLEKVLILEDGRKPASLFKSIGLILGGLAVSLVGVGLFFVGRSGS